MSYEFVRQMQRKAERLAQQGGYNLGVKPFHSYAGLFEETAKRVLIGLAPGGREKSVRLDQHHRHLERVYEDPGFNSYLDEVWETKTGGEHPMGQAPLQRNIRKVFEELFGDDAEQELRNTPCLNVVPFRAFVRDMPSDDWHEALEWVRQILDRLNPRLIICYSDSKRLRSCLPSLSSSVGAKFVMDEPHVLLMKLPRLRKKHPELFE